MTVTELIFMKLTLAEQIFVEKLSTNLYVNLTNTHTSSETDRQKRCGLHVRYFFITSWKSHKIMACSEEVRCSTYSRNSVIWTSRKQNSGLPKCLSGAAIPRTTCCETPLSLSLSVCCEKFTGADERQIDVCVCFLQCSFNISFDSDSKQCRLNESVL
jgi:hypothetical protein